MTPSAAAASSGAPRTAPDAEPSFRFGFADAGLLMTPEQFDATEPEDWEEGYAYEILRGVLVVTPIPLEAEGDPNEELGYLLRRYRDDHPQGSALNATLAERFVSTENRRRADRVIWAGLGRRPDPKRDQPTIVVEFVSGRVRDRRRDYDDKRREYLDAGVSEYWVVDRFQRRLTVFRRPPADPAELVIEADGIYRPDLLPGFELPLARLLAAADRWTDRG